MLVQHEGVTVPADQIARPIQNTLRQARTWKQKMEPMWQLLLQYAAGRHWLVIDDRDHRSIRRIQDLDPRYQGRELYTADIISEYRDHVLGELGSDDDRPELLLQQDSAATEDFQAQLNRAVGYAWEYESEADEALAEADQLCADLGTSAIRCRWDPGQGPMQPDQIPHINGKPVFGDERAQLMGQYEAGPIPGVEVKQIPEGRIVLEAISPFGMLVPPSVARERQFPWEAVIRAVPIDEVKELWPETTKDLGEDRDISSTLGPGAREPTDAGRENLKGHVWVTTYYERPTARFQKGRVFYFAGSEFEFLGLDPQLPYCGPNGQYRSGISYFHWRRVSGRFFSRGLVESLKDSQRAINKRRTQINEIIDKGQPYTLVPRGANIDLKKTKVPFEVVYFDPQVGQAQPVTGHGPGPWMQAEVEALREDAEHAAGIRGPALGENPAGVTTYGQLALLKEGDAVKRQPALRDRKLSIARMVENMVHDMRTYWGDQKQIMLAEEDEDRVEAETFNATRIPTFFIVKVAKGAPKPRSQGAEITKIGELWQAGMEAGVVPQNPDAWVRWRHDSIEAGQAVELPQNPADEHGEKAELENHRLWQGEMVEPAYYDPPNVHVPIHRQAQIQAEMAGEMEVWQLLENHIRWHEVKADENARKQAEQQAQASAQLAATQEAAGAQDAEVQAEADHGRQMEMQQAQADQQQQLQAQQQPNTGGK